MANYLVGATKTNDQGGKDGIVITSTNRLFCVGEINGTSFLIYTSTDLGVTWSLFTTLSVANGEEGGLFVDSSDNLHVVTRDAAGTSDFTYRRYDSPGYALAVTETVVSDVSASFDPMAIIVNSAGTVYVFFEDQPGAQAGRLYYAKRTVLGTWNIQIWQGAGEGENISYDVLLSSDGTTVYVALQKFLAASPTSAPTYDVLIRNEIGVLFNLNGNLTNTYNYWLAEVNGAPRLYASLIDTITGSASILYRDASSGPTTLFTASNATHALRGIGKDDGGINIFYGTKGGGAGTKLLRRRHLFSGTIESEVEEIPPPAFELFGNFSRGYMDVSYLRSISNYNGGAGIYGQPSGSTRFFSTLVAVSAASNVNEEDFLSEWGIGEVRFPARSPK